MANKGKSKGKGDKDQKGKGGDNLIDMLGDDGEEDNTRE